MKKISTAIISGMLLGVISMAHALNVEDIYQKVNKSVYTLYTVNFYDKSPESLGSAIAVTDHILATNCHVALTGNYLGIVIKDEFKLGTLFFRDVNRDICFVEVPGITFSPVNMRNSKDVRVGEQVFAVGNPEGLEKSISQGIISNKRSDRGGDVLQTDASVSFGSSGGGLFDHNGELIGITNSVDRYSKNIAFAIPSEWVSQILFPKNKEEAKQMSRRQSKMKLLQRQLIKLVTLGRLIFHLYVITRNVFFSLLEKTNMGKPLALQFGILKSRKSF